MDARLEIDPPSSNCPVAALSAAFEAQLNACCPSSLTSLGRLMELLAEELPRRSAVRSFCQQWPVERICNNWQDFRVATIKLFRSLRTDAAQEMCDCPCRKGARQLTAAF